MPACAISPTNTEEVTIALKLLSKFENTQFAVRGGGHTPFAGSASIADSIVFVWELSKVT